MPVRPAPFTYKCQSCGWAKTFAPCSDVLFEKYPDACPKCGKADLVHEIESNMYSKFKSLIGDSMSEALDQQLKRLFR